MKKFNLLVLALALFTVTIATADPKPLKPTDELRVQIIDLIGTNIIADMEVAESNADVLFTVNSKKELILLSVDSENDQLENYLKRKLNYKKVNHRPSKPGEIYLLPVKMVKDIL